MIPVDKIEPISYRKRRGLGVVKKGPLIDKVKYETIVNYILTGLHERDGNQISLIEWIDLSGQSLLECINGNLWYLLQLKNDLEARHIVTITVNPKYQQNVILNRRRMPLYF